MPDFVIALLVKPFVTVTFFSIVLAGKMLCIRYFPPGRAKNLLLKELWLTDWERHARQRAGLLPPKPIRARSIAWQMAGYRFGRWIRLRLR